MTSVLNKTLTLIQSVDSGLPKPEHFHIDEEEYDLEKAKNDCPEGGVVLQSMMLSADPYLRFHIRSSGQVHPGQLMRGHVAGKVLESKNDSWVAGDLFAGYLPFQTYLTLDEESLRNASLNQMTEYIDESQLNLAVGILGMTGSTSYAGIIGLLQSSITTPGKTIFITAASGAVGSIAGMLVKNVCGLRVIGSCGGAEKCTMIREKFGFDEAIDYKQFTTKEDFVHALQAAAPDGIDYFFDNVGGVSFEAALEVLKPKGHVVVCGHISHYNEEEPSGTITIPAMKLVFKQWKVEGFVCAEWLCGAKGNFLPDMAKWISEGKIHQEETVWEGLERWPEAFQSLFVGSKTGKVVVRL